ncbi:MAG: hypothetical protein ABSG80_17180 [Verrucomicrobiota bacterium]
MTQTDIEAGFSSPKLIRLRPVLRDFAKTSRRDKPGWSRGIRPVIIHAAPILLNAAGGGGDGFIAQNRNELQYEKRGAKS